MCAIVDNNMRDRFFGSPVDPELQPLWKWINDGKGVLVVGGRLREELYGSVTARRVIQEWIRTRRAKDTEDDSPGEVEAKTREIEEHCRSNDAHVVALARLSGARRLCSNDRLLHQDFGNLALINDPPGRVYQNRTHERLLTHDGRCPLDAPAAQSRQRRRNR